MTRLAFAPLIPMPLLTALAVIALLITAYAFFVRARGAWARGLAFAVLIFALGGPLLVREKHAALSDVAVIVTDRSQSMSLCSRTAQAEAARNQVKKLLAAQPGLTVRETSVTTTATGENNGTQAFAALNAALADVPESRVAGAILITDGEVHDAPAPGTLHAPLQVLVAGKRGERDRKLTVQSAARFAIVGQWAPMRLRIDDLGGGGETSAVLDIRIDGKPFGSRIVPVGQDTDIKVPVNHEGENLIELSAGPGPAELTLENNRAVVTVSGVRDRLRVLLVSGEPHAGERVWRNLLKADPSVDLVHFTILRPPDKQDSTPLNELALIAFPSRELFQEKLGSFDLVVFDRYTERGVLPMAYFEKSGILRPGWRRAADFLWSGILRARKRLSHAAIPGAAGAADRTDLYRPVQADGDRGWHGPPGDARTARKKSGRPQPGQDGAHLGPLVPHHRRQQDCRPDRDGGCVEPSTAGAGSCRQGPRRRADERPDLAVGARL